MIKKYICKFCKFSSTRKITRAHIKEKHLAHSSIHQKSANGQRMPSIISENTLTEDFI